MEFNHHFLVSTMSHFLQQLLKPTQIGQHLELLNQTDERAFKTQISNHLHIKFI